RRCSRPSSAPGCEAAAGARTEVVAAAGLEVLPAELPVLGRHRRASGKWIDTSSVSSRLASSKRCAGLRRPRGPVRNLLTRLLERSNAFLTPALVRYSWNPDGGN